MTASNIKLVPQTIEETRLFIASMNPEEKGQLSADYLEKLEASTGSDPWVHGFFLVQIENNMAVGKGGFKGPPDSSGMVEIAYCVFPQHQGKGFATEGAAALLEFARGDEKVKLVRAHTLPTSNASTRVLTKCGFENRGEVIDPEDGPVWRWEKLIEK